jgi:GNAT superfamily N-acetyltransferase
MPPYSIRTAVESDLAGIEDLYRRSSLSNAGDRAALLANPDVLTFERGPVDEGRTRVAVDGGRIIGFSTISVIAPITELDDLFVDPDWMRQGVGTALVDDLANFARSEGIERIEVTGNPHARSFYEAVGFIPDGATSTRFGPGLRMHLNVTRERRSPRDR